MLLASTPTLSLSSSPSSTTSLKGAPHTTNPVQQRPVYQYVQELRGITSVKYGPRDFWNASSLEKHADVYVQSHGFTITAIIQVHQVLRMCITEEQFVERLVEWGHPVKQAKWLWFITNKTPKAEFATIAIT